MYHYLFTNDLRNSTLDESLKKAGYCFATNTVPTSAEDKSANNNMTTLGFYFTLNDKSNCARAAASGNVRAVVLNFIKKFQFPNMRTSAAFNLSKEDGIQLAPMRVIIKLLYTMNLLHGNLVAHLSKEEIKYFIFYNETVAKKKNPDISLIINQILEYRKTGVYPETVSTLEEEHQWKHEDRQIREMIRVLIWSGCIIEKDGNYVIDNDELSRSNKADIFDIITCDTFWEGSTLESYRAYMDLEETIDLESTNIPEESFENIDEYKKAAIVLRNFIAETGFEFSDTHESTNTIREEFINKYHYEILGNLKDEELLERVFYTNGDNTEALCCWIEMNKECKYAFGSISGGSAYKFGLFQKKSTGVWTTGSPQKSQELSRESAIAYGRKIINALVCGAKIIESAALTSLQDYEKLDEELQEGVGAQYYNWSWFHKYYSIIFQDKFSGYHNEEWQRHILYCFGIQPSQKYYARSGQIAMIQNYGEWNYIQFFSAHLEKYGMPKTFIRIGTQGKENYLEKWRKNGIVGIGWAELGSLQEYLVDNGLDKSRMSEVLEQKFYLGDLKTASRKAGEIIRFYGTDENSIFVPAAGERIFSLVDYIGEYYYDDTEEFSHLKTGRWSYTFQEGECLPDKTEGLRTTCVQIKNEENLIYLYEKYYAREEMEETENLEAVKLKNCMEIDRNQRGSNIHPLNCIIYGAPGTGKTYSTAEYAQAIITEVNLKDFKEQNTDRKTVMKKYNELIKNEQIVFTTFHQSYGYEEFIQGLRPDTKASGISFKIVDGIFKRIADKALNDLENNYVIIIDEINRANISKVFGELITLVEEDKRWGELNQTCATLQSGDIFAVPNNLYIVGTMNSADKSISLIDAALRRRFEFIEQKPDSSLVNDPILHDVLEKLNRSLVDQLDSADLLIGHSYFMNRTNEELPVILNNNIIPLLYEYFYDNKKKVIDVLGKAVESIDYVIEDDKLGRIHIERKIKL